MNSKYISIVFHVIILFINSGCKKLIEIGAPVTSTTSANVFNTDATAIATLTGIYTKLGFGYYGTFATGRNSVSLRSGLSADEFSLYSGAGDEKLTAYYQNKLSATLTQGSEYWSELYSYIFTCNTVLEGLQGATSLNSTIKQQLLGEARFMRAFFISTSSIYLVMCH